MRQNQSHPNILQIYMSFPSIATCLFLALTLAAAAPTPAPASPALASLQSGCFHFQDPTQNTQTYMIQFATAFQTAPQLALTLNSLAMNAQNLPAGFMLLPQTVTASGVNIQWERQVRKWIKLSVGYLASSRADLLLGYAICSPNSSGDLTVPLGTDVGSLTSPIARVFLMGCQGKDSLSCAVLPRSLNATHLTVASEAGNKVAISYLVFSPGSAGFVSYGGRSGQQNLRGTYSSDIHRTIAYTDYILMGFSQLILNAQPAQTLTASVDSDWILSVSTDQKIDSYQIFYIVIGKTAKEQCADQQLPYQMGRQCLPSCPTNSVAYTYPNGGTSCRNCSPKMNLTAADGKCICLSGYALTNGFCLQQVKVDSERNRTADGEKQTNVQTAVATNTSSPIVLKTSEENCQKEVKQEVKKAEDTPRQVASNNPILTPQELLPSPQQQTNQQSPQQFTQQSANIAKPQSQEPPIFQPTPSYPPYIPSNNQAASCSNYSAPTSCPQPNTFLLNDQCLCKVGFSNINGYCQMQDSPLQLQPIFLDTLIPQPSPTQTNRCGEGFDNGLGICVCSGGLVFSSGRCVQPNCYPPSYPDSSGVCRCPNGYQMQQGICVQCLSPGIFDYSLGKCIYLCGDNSFYDQTKKECACTQGYGLTANGKCDICEDNSFLKDGYCVECPLSTLLDSASGKCHCQPGTVLDQAGKCIRRCGEFEKFDESTNSCACEKGLGRLGRRCAICPDSQVVDANGNCAACPPMQQPINGECRCQQGLIQKGDRCLPCDSQPTAFLLRKSCAECATGAVRVGGVCQLQDKLEVTNAISMSGQPVCGNGIIEKGETCDDRNNADGDGCDSSCQVEKGYTCSRMPSQCVKTAPNTPTPTPAPPRPNSPTPPLSTQNSTANPAHKSENLPKPETRPAPAPTTPTPAPAASPAPTPSGASLQLSAKIRGNSNQLFLTLDTGKPFDFADQSTMQNFLKAKFIGCAPPTLFCSQRPTIKNLFDCLLIFPSGVPNRKFKTDFSYNYQGDAAQLQLDVDPLNVQSNQANSRASSRVH